MPAELWAVIDFTGFVVAASLFAFGVWKLDMRLLAVGAALAGIAWLGIAFTNPDEWASRELAILRLQPVDSLRNEMVAGAVVNAIEPSQSGSSKSYRMPTRLERRSDERGPFLVISLVIELQVKGSLIEQHNAPVAHSRIVDQELEISAPGYRPWRGKLTELLPGGWTFETTESPIVIEMQPE